MRKTQYTVRVSDALAARIAAHQERMGINRSAVIAIALARGLDEMTRDIARAERGGK